MHINKFRISADATNKLRVLRQRSGLTPNLLCRMAMTASFESGSIGLGASAEPDGQEFNAYTLFGADQPIFITMLRLVEAEDGEGEQRLDEQVLLKRLRAHIDRGLQYLSARIKTPADVADLLGARSA
jgi:DNA sulfur modification protein DndE